MEPETFSRARKSACNGFSDIFEELEGLDQKQRERERERREKFLLAAKGKQHSGNLHNIFLQFSAHL